MSMVQGGHGRSQRTGLSIFTNMLLTQGYVDLLPFIWQRGSLIYPFSFKVISEFTYKAPKGLRVRDQMELEKVYFVNQIMLTEPNEKIMHFDENKSNVKSSFFHIYLLRLEKSVLMLYLLNLLDIKHETSLLAHLFSIQKERHNTILCDRKEVLIVIHLK